FSAAIDPASLPQTPQDSLAADASVFLTEFASGRRVPVRVHYRAKGGKFARNDLLPLCPFPGLPLFPRTQYTATVTTDVRTETGVAIARGGSTTFTTGDPTSAMKALRDAIYRDLPTPPQAKMVTWYEAPPGSSYDEYQGIYDAPFYQQGTVPF